MEKYSIQFSLMMMDIYIQIHFSSTIIQILSLSLIQTNSKLLL